MNQEKVNVIQTCTSPSSSLDLSGLAMHHACRGLLCDLTSYIGVDYRPGTSGQSKHTEMLGAFALHMCLTMHRSFPCSTFAQEL